jgi:hypothetical protein
MIYLLWVLLIVIFLILWGIADSLTYQTLMRKSMVSPGAPSPAITELYGFHVKYSPLVEPGVALFIKGDSIWNADYVVFHGDESSDSEAWCESWQRILEREED